MLALGSVLCASLAFAQTTPAPAAGSAAQSTTAPATKAKKSAAPAKAPPTAAEIADAKAKGMVWVNLNTKVYHGSADKEYGTTKNGKFMTEADAKAAGNRAAKN